MKYFEECVITEVKQQSKTKPPHYDQDQKHLTCNEDVKDAVGEDAAKTMKEPGTSNVAEIDQHDKVKPQRHLEAQQIIGEEVAKTLKDLEESDIAAVRQERKTNPEEHARGQQLLISDERINDSVAESVTNIKKEIENYGISEFEQQDKAKPVKHPQDQNVIDEDASKAMKYSEKHCPTEIKQKTERSKVKPPQSAQNQRSMSCSEDVHDTIDKNAAKTRKDFEKSSITPAKEDNTNSRHCWYLINIRVM